MLKSVTMATVVAISTTEALQVDQWKRPVAQKVEWAKKVNIANPYAIRPIKKVVVHEKKEEEKSSDSSDDSSSSNSSASKVI